MTNYPSSKSQTHYELPAHATPTHTEMNPPLTFIQPQSTSDIDQDDVTVTPSHNLENPYQPRTTAPPANKVIIHPPRAYMRRYEARMHLDPSDKPLLELRNTLEAYFQTLKDSDDTIVLYPWTMNDN